MSSAPPPPPTPSSQLFTNHRQQMKHPQRPGAKCLSEPSSLCSLIVCSPRTRKPTVPTVNIRCLANSSVSTTRSALSFLCGQAAAQESCRNASAGAKPTMLLGPSKMLSTSHSCSSCGSSVSRVISLWRGGTQRKSAVVLKVPCSKHLRIFFFFINPRLLWSRFE